jgi:hypothetical protein
LTGGGVRPANCRRGLRRGTVRCCRPGAPASTQSGSALSGRGPGLRVSRPTAPPTTRTVTPRRQPAGGPLITADLGSLTTGLGRTLPLRPILFQRGVIRRNGIGTRPGGHPVKAVLWTGGAVRHLALRADCRCEHGNGHFSRTCNSVRRPCGVRRCEGDGRHGGRQHRQDRISFRDQRGNQIALDPVTGPGGGNTT